MRYVVRLGVGRLEEAHGHAGLAVNEQQLAHLSWVALDPPAAGKRLCFEREADVLADVERPDVRKAILVETLGAGLGLDDGTGHGLVDPRGDELDAVQYEVGYGAHGQLQSEDTKKFLHTNERRAREPR